MAHKKGLGSSRNGRESNPNMLGVKVFAGQQVTGGEMIVRQRGTKLWPGEGTGLGHDHTIFAKSGRQGRLLHRPQGADDPRPQRGLGLGYRARVTGRGRVPLLFACSLDRHNRSHPRPCSPARSAKRSEGHPTPPRRDVPQRRLAAGGFTSLASVYDKAKI